MIEYLWQFIPNMFAIIIIVAVIETFLSARWVPGYFSKGIPIYKRNFGVGPS
jgi:hypothetical protein